MIISLPFHNNTLSFDTYPLMWNNNPAGYSCLLQCVEEGKEHVKMWASAQDVRDAIVNLIMEKWDEISSTDVLL